MSNKFDITAGAIAASIRAAGHDRGHESPRERHRHQNDGGDPEPTARPGEPAARPRPTVPNEGTEAGLLLYVA